MLKTRVITAVVLLAVLLAALFFLPPLGWAVFCALICALAAWEWGGLAGWGGKARVVYGIVLGCLCLTVSLGVVLDLETMLACEASLCLIAWALHELGLWVLALLFLLATLFWLLVVPFWLWRKWHLHSWVAAFVGVVVLIPPTLAFVWLRVNFSPWILLAVCALVWVADIAAYFSGRAFGGKKLAPNISPGKTWAGAFGAVIGVLVYGNVAWFAMGASRINPFSVPWSELHVLLLQVVFIVLAVWSIIGDLFESLLKRQAGVKDSSNLLPGHGGILDRIDSLTSTLVFVFIFYVALSYVVFKFITPGYFIFK